MHFDCKLSRFKLVSINNIYNSNESSIQFEICYQFYKINSIKPRESMFRKSVDVRFFLSNLNII